MDDPTDIREQERRQEAEAERLQLLFLNQKANLMWIMADRRGREFVADILDSTGVLSASFNPDPYVTANLEGRRAVGLALLNKLQAHTPREYLQMQAERINPTEE